MTFPFHGTVLTAAAAGGLALFSLSDDIDDNQPENRRDYQRDDYGAEIGKNQIHNKPPMLIPDLYFGKFTQQLLKIRSRSSIIMGISNNSMSCRSAEDLWQNIVKAPQE